MRPQAVAVDGQGNLVIADTLHNRVRVIAEKSGLFYGVPMTAGDIYTIAGDGDGGDGGPAVDAALGQPVGIAIDAAGNVVIAASGAGRICVIAAETGTFYGQSMTAGDFYTIAGNSGGGSEGDGIPAVDAGLPSPIGVTTDKNGNLLLADAFQVRVIAETTGTFYGQQMTAGDIYTVAGDLQLGGTFAGDGGPARKAGLATPSGIAVDRHGNVLIADEPLHRLRVVAATDGTFYGQLMRADHIYTVAGGGPGRLGDGGQGTAAVLDPYWVAVFGQGDLVIADQGNGRIRLLTH